ncbi:hypothetical protein D3C84_1060870 [compost metagenome]
MIPLHILIRQQEIMKLTNIVIPPRRIDMVIQPAQLDEIPHMPVCSQTVRRKPGNRFVLDPDFRQQQRQRGRITFADRQAVR